MCEPTTLFFVQAGLSAASAFQQHQTQKALAGAQKAHGEAQFAVAKDLATRSALRSYEGIRGRQQEEREAASADISRIARQAAVATGQVRQSAADAGVAGNSLSALLLDFQMQETDYAFRVDRNLQARDRQADREGAGVRDQTHARIISAVPAPVAEPSFLGFLLGAGAGTLDAFTSNAKYSSQTGTYSLKPSGSNLLDQGDPGFIGPTFLG